MLEADPSTSTDDGKQQGVEVHVGLRGRVGADSHEEGVLDAESTVRCLTRTVKDGCSFPRLWGRQQSLKQQRVRLALPASGDTCKLCVRRQKITTT